MDKMKLLWKYMKGSRMLYLMAIIAIGIAAFIQFLWPLVLRVTIDSIIGDQPLQVGGWLADYFKRVYEFSGGRSVLVQKLWLSSLILVRLTLLRGLFTYWKGKWSAIASESIIRNLRDQLYQHLQYLPFSYHSEVKTGDLIQRCTSDLETIRQFLAVQLVEVGRALFMVIFALSFMLPMDVKLTLISMTLVPVLFLFAFIFFQKVKRLFKEADETEGELSTVLQENLSGVRVVRAFAQQKYEIEKFDQKNGQFRDQSYKLIRLLALYWASSDFISMFQISTVVILGTYYAAIGQISLGTFLAFSTYIGMLLWPIRQMGRVLTDMGKALVSVERISEIFETEIEDIDTGEYLTELRGELEFRDVSFGYATNLPTLENISFRVEAGETVAILGPTGSGKSSLVNLIPRLFEPSSGEIFLDGKPLRDISKRCVRENVGIVLQEPFLFSKTVADNISLSKQNAREEDIFQAAQIASVHDVILGFEQGYQTAVGEKGVTLSGGQKQRLAIARTVINDAKILIFDDSLSAVDTETDAAIRKRLRRRSQAVTTFIVSHRLSTLMEADKILVLENGKISASGTHEQLLKQAGLYQRVWKIQNQLDIEVNENDKI
ncbi:MAG: ABC transporter ATP-binding protein [Candidatus Cloacimonadales bacterium]